MTDTHDERDADLLRDAVGERLAAVARIHWTHGGRVDDSTGPLELRFEDGRTLVVEGTPVTGLADEIRMQLAKDPVFGTTVVVDIVEDWQDVYLAVLGRRLVFAADE